MLINEIVCWIGMPCEELIWQDVGLKKIIVIDEMAIPISYREFVIPVESLEQFDQICKQETFQKFEFKIGRTWEAGAAYQRLYYHHHARSSIYKNFLIEQICNQYINQEALHDEHSFLKLENCFKNVPAIICGAGPSLFEFEQFLNAQRGSALFLSGGAGIKALSKIGITPDIAAGIDPVYEGDQLSIPFFYQKHVSYKALEKISGPKFQVEDQDYGWTVSNFCLSLAAHFGCNPIILAGVDLAYFPEGTKYQGEGSKGRFIYQEKQTQIDFMLAANWIEEFTYIHNEIEVRQLSDRGIVNIPLWSKNQNLPVVCFASSMEKLYSLWQGTAQDQLWDQSLERSQGYLDLIIESFQRNYPNHFDLGQFHLYWYELSLEEVYQKLWIPLWDVWRFIIERNLETEYEKQLHQALFFQTVVKEHRRVFYEIRNRKSASVDPRSKS